MLQLRNKEQQEAATGDVKYQKRQPQADVAIKRYKRKVGRQVTADRHQHGDADGLGVECAVEYAVVHNSQGADERKESNKQVVLLRCSDDAWQIGEAAQNGMTANIIEDSLRQAEAYGPNEADAQCVVEHRLVVLAKGNARVDGACLRQTGKDITHNELNLKKYGIGCQKLAAKGRALVHKAVDHDDHTEHAHSEVGAALHHLAAGGT